MLIESVKLLVRTILYLATGAKGNANVHHVGVYHHDNMTALFVDNWSQHKPNTDRLRIVMKEIPAKWMELIRVDLLVRNTACEPT